VVASITPAAKLKSSCQQITVVTVTIVCVISREGDQTQRGKMKQTLVGNQRSHPSDVFQAASLHGMQPCQVGFPPFPQILATPYTATAWARRGAITSDSQNSTGCPYDAPSTKPHDVHTAGCWVHMVPTQEQTTLINHSMLTPGLETQDTSHLIRHIHSFRHNGGPVSSAPAAKRIH